MFPVAKLSPIWDRSYDFENIFAKKFGKKLAFFAETTASFCKILIITLFFLRKNAIFSPKIGKKSQKTA
jgi:hypothetical protein